jgi:hypothetical protein
MWGRAELSSFTGNLLVQAVDVVVLHLFGAMLIMSALRCCFLCVSITYLIMALHAHVSTAVLCFTSQHVVAAQHNTAVLYTIDS